MDRERYDVIVVGAGHNGLTAGCYLAKEGLSVLAIEASPTVGGMTSTNPVLPGAPGHRINEGAMDASLIRTTTMPDDLGLDRFGLREVEVDPPYAWLDEDGSSLCVWRDPRCEKCVVRDWCDYFASHPEKQAEAQKAVGRRQ